MTDVAKPKRKNRRNNYGEDNSRAKLTWAQVREIRQTYRWRSRDANTIILAKRYGVAKETIQDVVRYKRWVE